MIPKYFYLSKATGNCMYAWWGGTIARWKHLVDVWFYLFDQRIKPTCKGFKEEVFIPPECVVILPYHFKYKI